MNQTSVRKVYIVEGSMNMSFNARRTDGVFYCNLFRYVLQLGKTILRLNIDCVDDTWQRIDRTHTLGSPNRSVAL